jgi:amino acid transporter
MPGMHINYHIIVLLTISISNEEARLFAQIFGCNISDFPFSYLGVPLNFSKLRKQEDYSKKKNRRITPKKNRRKSYRGTLILLDIVKGI